MEEDACEELPHYQWNMKEMRINELSVSCMISACCEVMVGQNQGMQCVRLTALKAAIE